MKTDYQFISDLFNNAEQTVMNVNKLPVKAYKVRVNGNTVSIESIWESKLGCLYGTNDVRTIVPSKKQLDRLQRRGELFYIYED